MKIATRLMLVGTFLILAACGRQGTAPSKPQDGAATTAGAATDAPVPAATAPANAKSTFAVASVAVCSHCKWSEFENHPASPVEKVECTNSNGTPYHCHLETPKAGLTRDVTVIHDLVADGYSFRLDTRGSGQADRMECENLVADINNPRVIEGTCKIVNAEQGPGVHHFRAYLAPRLGGSTLPDGTPWPEIRFEFRHKPFAQPEEGDPVHNGEGHVPLVVN